MVNEALSRVPADQNSMVTILILWLIVVIAPTSDSQLLLNVFFKSESLTTYVETGEPITLHYPLHHL